MVFGMVKMPAYWRPDEDGIQIHIACPRRRHKRVLHIQQLCGPAPRGHSHELSEVSLRGGDVPFALSGLGDIRNVLCPSNVKITTLRKEANHVVRSIA